MLTWDKYPILANSIKMRRGADGSFILSDYESKSTIAQINHSVKTILDLCDGTQTVKSISESLSSQYGEKSSRFLEKFLKTLNYLYALKIIRVEVNPQGNLIYKRHKKRLIKRFNRENPLVTEYISAITAHACGELKEAKLKYRKVLARNPAHPRCAINLARLLTTTGEHEEAFRLLTKSEGIGDDILLQAKVVQALRYLSRQCRLSGNLALAMKSIEESLSIAVKYQYYRQLAPILLQKAKCIQLRTSFIESIPVYSQAIMAAYLHNSSHDLSVVMRDIASEYMENHHVDTAIKILRECLTRQIEDGQSWSALASTLLRKGQFKSAIRAYGLAVSFGGTNPSILNNLGVAHANSGQLRKALKYFNQARKIDPTFAHAVRNAREIELYFTKSQANETSPLQMESANYL